MNTAVQTQSQGVAPAPQNTGLWAFNQVLTSDRTQSYLSTVLAEKKSSFVNNIVAIVANSRELQGCEPLSVIYAGIKATALGLPLDPNLGQAYVIPYGNKTGRVAQFQIGYKGLIQLAIRSGQITRLNVTDVREGEMQDFDLLTGEIRFKAHPQRIDRPVVGYVAYFALGNGFSKALYMTMEEIKAHRQRFSKARNSPWDTDFDAMAQKTVLKLLINRYAPLSVELADAIRSDQAVFRSDALMPEYLDNPQRQIEVVQAEEVPSYSDEELRSAVCSLMEATDTEALNARYNALPPELRSDRYVLNAYKDRADDLEQGAPEDLKFHE